MFSSVDIVKILIKAYNEGDRRQFSIPSSANVIIQESLLIQRSKDFKEFFADDFSKGRITARFEINKSQQLARQMPDIEGKIQNIFGDTAGVTPTGLIFLIGRMESYLLSSQIRSFLLAFTIILIVIAIILRSVKLGILVIIPNILPILFTLALMPVLQISLDIGTVMIAGIAMGLVVDETIHFLSRFNSK